MFVEFQQSYIFDSGTQNGAKNKSEDGSTFDVQLPQPIVIPKEAVNCTIEVIQANVWYTTPNISIGKNNNKFKFHTDMDRNVTKTLTFPDGLYSVTAFNTQLALLLVDGGFEADLFSVVGDDATQKTVITYGAIDLALNFSGGDTCKDILGFEDIEYDFSTTAGEPAFGQDIARFNTLNSYLIHTDLVSQGIPVNSIGASIISQVPISSRPGSQIVYQPQNPARTDLTNLIGLPRNSFRIWITDQNNEYLDTNGEDFTVVVIIRYIMPIIRNQHSANTY